MFLAACFLSIFAGLSFAQSCVDWGNSVSVRFPYPGTRGDACALVGLNCYVAGDSLAILDVTAAQAPAILGLVQLPGTATQIVVTGDRAFVSCGTAGLVIVDCSDLTSPTVTQIYGAAEGVGSIAMGDGVLAAVVGQTEIHLLDPLAAAPMAPLSVVPGSATRTNLAFWGTALFFQEGESVFPVDVTLPATPSLGTPRNISSTYGIAGMTVGPQGIWAVAVNEFAQFQITFVLHDLYYDQAANALMLESTSTLDDECWYRYVGSHYVSEQYSGPRYLVDPVTLEPGAAFDGGGGIAIGGNRVAVSSLQSGLVLWRGIELGVVPPILTVSQRAGHVGLGSLLGSFDVSNSYGGAGGGYSATLDFEIRDMANPLNPSVLVAGDYNVNQGADFGPASVSFSFCGPDYYLIRHSEFDGSKTEIYALAGASHLGGIATPSGSVFHPGVARYFHEGLLTSFTFDGVSGLQEMASHPFSGSGGPYLSPDPGLLIDGTGSFVHSYDISDPLTLVDLGSFDTGGAVQYDGVWVGRLYHFVRDDNLFVIDFTAPTSPVISSGLALGSGVTGFSVSGDDVVVFYGDGFRLVEPCGAGAFCFASAQIFHANLGMQVVWDGDTAYFTDKIDETVAYDFSRRDLPRYIGVGAGASGHADIRGGFLVAGAKVLPLHCQMVSAVQAELPVARLGASAFPNPFNPRININFTLPRANRTSVGIYDVRGRKVAAVFEGFVDGGEHEMSWSGRTDSGLDAPSGQYFIRVMSGSQVETIKVVLVR